MNKWAILAVASVATAVGAAGLSRADNEPSPIKRAMKTAMGKKGLLGKVAGGQATEEQKQELVKLFRDMAATAPPHGDPADWKARTDALIAAAQAAADGQADAGALLKRSADCKACHSAHREE